MTATRGTRIALLVAVLWSIGFLAAGLLLPAYSGGDTLADENGSWVVVLLAAPLVVSLVVAALLLRPGHGTASRGVAGVLVSLLGVLNLLSLLTVGILVVPVTVSLVLACTFDAVGRPAQIR